MAVAHLVRNSDRLDSHSADKEQQQHRRTAAGRRMVG